MSDSKLRTSLLTLGLIGVAALGFMWWQQKSVPQDPIELAMDSQDPIVRALARDSHRLRLFRESLPKFDNVRFVAEACPKLTRAFDTSTIYSNQWGPVDSLLRDKDYLVLEALLHGPSPVSIQIQELKYRAELLKSAADAALNLTRELETPEGLNVLGNCLWSDAVLKACARPDAKSYQIVAGVAKEWASGAVKAMDDQTKADAIASMRTTYEIILASQLAATSRLSDNPVDAALAPDRLLSEDWVYADRRSAHEQSKARSQIAAIALGAVADNRVKVLEILDEVALEVNAENATNLMDSFSGPIDLPKSVWDLGRVGTAKMVATRVNMYLLEPAGVAEAQDHIWRCYKELPKTIEARLRDEADRDELMEAPPIQPAGGGFGGKIDIDEKTIRKELIIDCALSVADITATALEFGGLAALLFAPEPIVSKGLFVAGVIIFAADMTWEAMKAYPRWQRIAGTRLSTADAICGAWIGRSPHLRLELEKNTVVTAGSAGQDGAMLDAELTLWALFRQSAEGTRGR